MPWPEPARAQEWGFQVDVNHRVPIGFGQFVGRAAHVHARIVDQDVHRAAERAFGLGRHALDFVGTGNVGGERGQLPARRLADLVGGGFALGPRSADDGNVGPGLGERLRDHAAQPFGAAGDERAAAVNAEQIEHGAGGWHRSSGSRIRVGRHGVRLLLARRVAAK
jgi:hypothetical protein